MRRFDEQYIDLCKRILAEGEELQNYRGGTASTGGNAMPEHRSQAETGAETIRLPHQVMQFDLGEELPILTTKKVAFKSAVLEILWIFQVASNRVDWLQERGVKIWDEWEIGPDGVYQGRNINQIWRDLHPEEPAVDFAGTIGTAYGWIVKRYGLMESLISTLRQSPGNRRMVISLWQNEWLATAALPSCVWNSQWNITGERLNTLVMSRSTDVPLGLPFNILQYAVLNQLVAQVVGARPGLLTFMTNDAHIYRNQIEGIREQIRRYEMAMAGEGLPEAPKLWINPKIREFGQFDNSRELADIKLQGYKHLGAIRMPVTE